MRRRPLRLAGTALGIAVTVAFVASLGAFFAASTAFMTRRATAAVPVDWQVQLAPGTDAAAAGRIVDSAPGVVQRMPMGFATVPGFTSASGGTVQTTGTGRVLGLPPGYATEFPGEIRFLLGAHDGVLLAQQTAANLHATVGSTVTVRVPGARPDVVTVDGVVELPFADSLFQAVGVPAGAAPTAPPDNVLLLPDARWHRLFDPVANARPGAVLVQFHVGLSPALPPDPGRAFTDVLARAHGLEADMAGSGLVGNNVGAVLDAARKDAAYSRLLFLFLGAPGVILAALLTLSIGATGGDRRRREQALLRIRGATPGRIQRVAAAETALVGLAGVVVGLAGAILVGRVLLGMPGSALSAVSATSASVLGLVLGAAAVVLPARRDLRAVTVARARTQLAVATRPLWARLYVDLICLAGAGVLFWGTVKAGYQVVLAPEGVPTISVSYETFLAPLLLWVGSALFAWRVSTGLLVRGRRALARAVRPLARGLAGTVAASMSRQRRILARGLMITALTASFAVSTAVFNQTYAEQSRVDAELTNGADVAVTTAATAGLPPNLPDVVRHLSGVRASEPMTHRFAYVGNDLQDLYAIDPATIGRATPMSDAFFAGGHASEVLAKLGARPDGLLVSDETVKDFQLRLGDLVRLRLQFAGDRAYHVVDFHYVGVVREFPTAPSDSFLVANADYVHSATGTAAFETLLVATSGSPPAVAERIRAVLPPTAGATVRDVVTQLKLTRSGLTAIDLSGLTKLELSFAFILAAAACGLVLGLGLAERRRTLAIASALGAKTRQLASFVWSEAGFVTLGGLVLGVLAGWGVSFVLVKVLTGVFDPPPEHLFVPWAYLGSLGAVTLAAVGLAAGAAVRSGRRPVVEIVRDL